MLWLNPQRITLNDHELTDVRAIALSRRAHRTALEHGDSGPHTLFADVPEQIVTIKITRSPERHPTPPVSLADAVILSFRTAPNNSDAHASTISAPIVITAIETDFSDRAPPRQTITAVAVSPDGDADPITTSTPKGT